MLVFNLIKISSVENFLPVGWFSSSANSNDDHGNVKNIGKDATEDAIVRKPDSPALCEIMRKPMRQLL